MKDKRYQALEKCVRECAERAWWLAYSWVRNHDDANELVQRACEAACRSIKKMPQDNPWPWFAKILMNRVRVYKRDKKREIRLNDQYMAEYNKVSQSLAPDKAQEDQELLDELERELRQLPEAEREAVHLTHLCGMTHKEAAAVLQIPDRTLSRRVQEGIETLRRKMGCESASVHSALLAFPIVQPSGGYELAISSWLSASSVTNALNGTVILGGIAMSSKVVTSVACIISLALGVVLGGEVLGENILGGASSNSDLYAQGNEDSDDRESTTKEENSPKGDKSTSGTASEDTKTESKEIKRLNRRIAEMSEVIKTYEEGKGDEASDSSSKTKETFIDREQAKTIEKEILKHIDLGEKDAVIEKMIAIQKQLKVEDFDVYFRLKKILSQKADPYSGGIYGGKDRNELGITTTESTNFTSPRIVEYAYENFDKVPPSVFVTALYYLRSKYDMTSVEKLELMEEALFSGTEVYGQIAAIRNIPTIGVPSKEAEILVKAALSDKIEAMARRIALYEMDKRLPGNVDWSKIEELTRNEDKELAQHAAFYFQKHVPQATGFLVWDYKAGTEGDSLTVLKGDIIVSINDKPVESKEMFEEVVSKAEKDSSVSVAVYRMGNIESLYVLGQSKLNGRFVEK